GTTPTAGRPTATCRPSNVARSSAATAPSRVAYVFDRWRTVIASVATAVRTWSVPRISSLTASPCGRSDAVTRRGGDRRLPSAAQLEEHRRMHRLEREREGALERA